MADKTIYSHHVFLFPFRWDVGAPEELSCRRFENRLQRTKFVKLLDPRWKESRYYHKDPITYYNSANYFYEFARKAIYAFDGEESTVLNYHFDREDKDYNYLIERKIREGEELRTYKLIVQHIGLNIYSTGIGILSFNLRNEDEGQKAFDDILAINDFGRRMYPQFLDTSAKGDENEKQNLIEQTQYAFLAKSIVIKSDEEEHAIFEERFEDFSDEVKLKTRIVTNPSNLPNTPKSIAKFLGKQIGTTEHKDPDLKKAVIRAIMDDRNFVLCWYGNDVEIGKLGWNSTNKEYNFLDYDMNNDWLKYMFVDNSYNTIQSQTLRKKLSESHTYDRWVEEGTLYGISRYSLVCLSKTGWFQENILRKQIGGGVYFEMAQLLLAQRSSTIRFSDEATMLASKKFESDEAQYLHEQYMRFVNKLYFREATAQEQGIEMYSQLSLFMELDRDVKNLNDEIDELDQFESMKEQGRQTGQATKLTIVSTILLPATLIASILGMNTLDTSNLPDCLLSASPQWGFWISIIIGALFSLLIVIGLNKLYKLNLFLKNEHRD